MTKRQLRIALTIRQFFTDVRAVVEPLPIGASQLVRFSPGFVPKLDVRFTKHEHNIVTWVEEDPDFFARKGRTAPPPKALQVPSRARFDPFFNMFGCF